MTDYEEDFEQSVLWYCTNCLSLDIRDDDEGHPYCHSCGAQKDLDFAMDVWTWMQIYAKSKKASPLEFRTSYDDLDDVYGEDTESVASEADAYNSGLTVRDVMNLNLNKLDKI